MSSGLLLFSVSSSSFFFYWKISTLVDATLKILSILFFNSLWLHLRLFKFITDLYFHSFYYDGPRCGSLSYVSLWFIVVLDAIRFENTLVTVVFHLYLFLWIGYFQRQLYLRMSPFIYFLFSFPYFPFFFFPNSILQSRISWWKSFIFFLEHNNYSKIPKL